MGRPPGANPKAPADGKGRVKERVENLAPLLSIGNDLHAETSNNRMRQIVELLNDDSNPQACQQALASLSVYLTNQGFPTEQAMVRTRPST